jgi:hypothetical protein
MYQYLETETENIENWSCYHSFQSGKEFIGLKALFVSSNRAPIAIIQVMKMKRRKQFQENGLM